MRYDANWALAAHLLCLRATNTNHVFDRRGGFALDFARASTACASFVCIERRTGRSLTLGLLSSHALTPTVKPLRSR